MERLVDRSRCITDNNRLLSENWHGLDHSIPRLVTEDVNSGHVLETLRQLNPDVLLDHGTSIVSKQILSTSPLALNLHWGLSPYYRGTHCTEWALLNWDPFNIGVTIHKLTHQIDGGGIAAQQRAQVTASDTVHSLNLQLTVIGTELMSRILMRLDDGSPLAFHQQDTSKGYLKTMSQWHYRHHQWIRDMEKKKLLGQMLAHPSRKPELPIISLE